MVLDRFECFGPATGPAVVSGDLRGETTGPAVARSLGKPVPSTDTRAFLGEVAPARATGDCSGPALGFAIRSDPGASTDGGGSAELGRERSGVFR